MHAYLIGGGPGKDSGASQLFREALDGLPQRPLIAYVGAASDDSEGFRKRMAGLLVGARLEPVRLVRPKDPISAALQIIADADAIFLSGGDVDHGMQVLQDRGVVGPLRAAAGSGKRVLGVSAGSILAGRAWVRFPEDDDTRAERFECLGLVPLSFDAHAEEDAWAELRTLVRLSVGVETDPIGYGLPSGGALLYEGTADAPPKLSARGLPVVRIGVRDGVVAELAPLPL